MSETFSNFLQKKQIMNYRGKPIDLSKPLIMGILNITPDSFYDGGIYSSISGIMGHVEQMINDGADIIDIGACSTRPGAALPDEEEEYNRLLPVIKKIVSNFPDIPVSVDTFRSGIAHRIINEAGDCIINDISGGTMDPNMFNVVAQENVPYILMHIKGTPENMHLNPMYENLMKELILFFSERVALLRKLGVNDIIVDPGFGFGKGLEDNFRLLKELKALNILELPVLVGLSRKSMIYKTLNTTPQLALNGTICLNTIALLNGVNILRVHDVKEAFEVRKLVLATNM